MSREVSRRDFLKMGLVAGGAAFLEGCRNLKEEEIRAMPSVSIEEILNNPGKYEGREILKTAGYIQETGVSSKEIDQTGPTSKYTWQTTRVQFFRHRYKISSQPDMTGPSLDAASEEKITNFDMTTDMYSERKPMEPNALHRDFPKADASVNYEIIGRLLKAEKPDPNHPKYVYEIARVEVPAKK
jgi:hypothetical protein